jgi:hypothetical protein
VPERHKPVNWRGTCHKPIFLWCFRKRFHHSLFGVINRLVFTGTSPQRGSIAGQKQDSQDFIVGHPAELGLEPVLITVAHGLNSFASDMFNAHDVANLDPVVQAVLGENEVELWTVPIVEDIGFL